MTPFDFIVVGSGATGAIAATTLTNDGATVLILDGGQRDERYAQHLPQQTFEHLRRNDEEQYRYLLGDDFEAACDDGVGAGAQLTPPRRHVLARVAELLKVHASTFTPLESLALGGLASAWGLLCAVYSDAELARASLPIDAMRNAYQTVADRIGISGAAGDDARPFTYGDLAGVQPPLALDPTAARLAERYARSRAAMRAGGFALGRPALALLTQPRDGRSATHMRDMDFYGDDEQSAWRPAIAIDALRRNPRFAYAGDLLVTRFAERDDGVDVFALDVRTREERHFQARRLVLACGTLGSARIVLRSFAQTGARLPLLCNPYTYVPCLVPARVGRSMPERNTGLVQLVLFHDPTGEQRDVAAGTIFSYRSLLLFRILREMPLGLRDARALMQYLQSGFLLVGIDHAQGPSGGRQLWLEPDASSPTGDALAIAYALNDGERRESDARERRFMGALRKLGAWPLTRVRPPYGSSLHYAGTLPFGTAETPFSLGTDGRLHGTRRVYVADGSGFTFLPAKGLTLSLMANAHRIAAGLATGPR